MTVVNQCRMRVDEDCELRGGRGGGGSLCLAWPPPPSPPWDLHLRNLWADNTRNPKH